MTSTGLVFGSGHKACVFWDGNYAMLPRAFVSFIDIRAFAVGAFWVRSLGGMWHTQRGVEMT
jgi:hypothetical protein